MAEGGIDLKMHASHAAPCGSLSHGQHNGLIMRAFNRCFGKQ